MATYFSKELNRQFYSDLVLGGVISTDLGHSFREVNLVKTATMKLGSVLSASNVEAASSADADKVLVWTNAMFSIDDVPVGDTFTAVAAVRDVTLNRYLCVYSSGDAVDDAGVLALEERGLKLTAKILATS
ncbi:putative decoration protein [Klebsiella phage 05F01]|nr:putative decoration protein [Klebsiella phage 05F01]